MALHYSLGDFLTTGQHNEIRKCNHYPSSSQRGIKVIFKHMVAQSDLDKIINEIKILTQIDHPNILKVHEAYQDDKRIFIIQEVLNGGELFDYIVT